MTDHLEAARDRLGGLHDHLSRREVALAADDLHAILSAILDHLEEQQTPDPLDESNHLEEQQTPDPLDESNHTNRYDRHGIRWVWCDGCDGLRTSAGHETHVFGIGLSACWVNEHYGPLTFAPRQ